MVQKKSSITRERLIEVEFTCSFNADILVSSGGMHPQIMTQLVEIASKKIPVEVKMGLYGDDQFQDLLPKDFDIMVPDLLYTQIQLTKKLESINLQVKKCWATPSENSDIDRYTFIEDFCPVDKDDTHIFENPQIVQFSLKSFQWDLEDFENYQQIIFLHCQVIFCDQEIEVCETDCESPMGPQKRKGRSVMVNQAEKLPTTMKIGPIKMI